MSEVSLRALLVDVVTAKASTLSVIERDGKIDILTVGQ